MVKDGKVYNFIFNNIKYMRKEQKQAFSIKILKLLNNQKDRKKIIKEILLAIKSYNNFDAVGIRLKKGEDYPYYETSGFNQNFIEKENSLCALDSVGNFKKDLAGNVVIECMCGNVICGRTNSCLPFFSKGGSFWSNCTSKLISSTSQEDLQSRTRNRCVGDGYESVALIPLKSNNETIGLLQINNFKKNCFTKDLIIFFEGIGASIGIALARANAEEKNKFIINTALDAFFILNKDGKFVDLNEAYSQMTGYSREELLTMDVSNIDDKKSIDEFKKYLMQIRKSGNDFFESKQKCKNGTYVDVSVNVKYASDEIGLYFVFIKDITTVIEKRKLENEIIKISEKERKNISWELHDNLGQELGALNFLISTLKENIKQNKNINIQDLIIIEGFIKKSINHTKRLTTELSPVFLQTDLESALQELLKEIESCYNKKCIFESKVIKSIENINIANNLFYIAKEALHNAVKHSQANTIKLYFNSEKDSYELKIENNGCRKNSLKKRDNGLGMSIMKCRAEIIGAKLIVKSMDNIFSIIVYSK